MSLLISYSASALLGVRAAEGRAALCRGA